MLISDTFFNYYLTFIGLSGLFTLLCNYFIFQKIGYSGISGVIPIYNVILLFRRYYGSGWYFLTLFIPFIGIWFAFGVYNRLRKDFNKSLGWFILFLCIFSFVGYGILAFGSDIPRNRDYYIDEDKKPLI